MRNWRNPAIRKHDNYFWLWKSHLWRKY